MCALELTSASISRQLQQEEFCSWAVEKEVIWTQVVKLISGDAWTLNCFYFGMRNAKLFARSAEQGCLETWGLKGDGKVREFVCMLFSF